MDYQLLTTPQQVAMAGKVRRFEGSIDLLVVEDLQGQPMAYTRSESLARLYFAAPGMLDVMGRFAALCQKVADSNVDEKLKQEAIETLDDANMALRAAIKMEIV